MGQRVWGEETPYPETRRRNSGRHHPESPTGPDKGDYTQSHSTHSSPPLASSLTGDFLRRTPKGTGTDHRQSGGLSPVSREGSVWSSGGGRGDTSEGPVVLVCLQVVSEDLS